MVFSLMPAAFAVSVQDFTDISSAEWYYDDVSFVVQQKYFEGTEDTLFSPKAPMTRAMFVTVLARLDGVDTNDAVSPYSDVPSGAWYSGEVAWAAENKIVEGVDDDLFAPDQPVSRQQMATFMARYIASYIAKNKVTIAAKGSTEAFTDAGKIESYAAEAVKLCRSYELIDGFDDGSFGPTQNSSRAEVAAVVHRLSLLLKTAVKTPAGGQGGGTTASASVGTSADFINAAQASASSVTATLLATNTVTVHDDIPITNDSAYTLTLNLGSASVGDLTINAANARTININDDANGGASVGNLTINAPNATVTNYADMRGTATIVAVSRNSFDNEGDVPTIVMNGPGRVNDTQQGTPANLLINTEEPVTIGGKSTQINIAADNANVTLNTQEGEPNVNSSGSGVNLYVNTSSAVLGGNINRVFTVGGASNLTVQGTLDEVNNNSGNPLKLSGGGSIDKLNAGNKGVNIGNNSTGNTALSVGTLNTSGGTINAPANSINNVNANGNVNLNTSVGSVSTQSGTTLNLGSGVVVNDIATSGYLMLDGSGSVSQLDFYGDGTLNLTDATVNVSGINIIGDFNVDLSGVVQNLPPVTKKHPKPEGVEFLAPTTVGGDGTIVLPENSDFSAYEHRKVAGNWTVFSSTTEKVDAGTMHYVRFKATDGILAGESVYGIIPLANGVTSAEIQGTPLVGQTLTAVANVNATGTLKYEWKSGGEPVGKDSKTYTLEDSDIGQSITVKISNYNGTSYHESTELTGIIADKSALQKRIDKADEIQQGVTEKPNGTEAKDVAKGIVFVTADELKALTDAKAAADVVAKNDGAKTGAVTNAITELNKAIAAFEVAKQKVGTLDKVTDMKDALTTLIVVAKDATVDTATDANEVAPSASWVLDTVNTTYQGAIASAEAVRDNNDATAEQLSPAIADLGKAMITYIKAIRKGATLDNSTLLAAISAAELNAASVVVSVKPDKIEPDGRDVLPSQTWVTQTFLDAYTKDGSPKGAIQTAKAAAVANENTVQSDYIDALAALNGATQEFNANKQPGTKDIIAPVVTGVSVAKATDADKYTITFKSSEAGTYAYRVGSAEGNWPAGNTLTGSASPYTGSITYTPPTAGKLPVYIQVSDGGGNSTIVMVEVGTPVEPPATVEASIGSAKFETLTAALTAAEAGHQTVRLEKEASVANTAPLTIPDGVTLDLNGKALTVDDGGTLVIAGDLSQTPTGWSATKTVAGGAIRVDGGTLTINGTLNTASLNQVTGQVTVGAAGVVTTKDSSKNDFPIILGKNAVLAAPFTNIKIFHITSDTGVFTSAVNGTPSTANGYTSCAIEFVSGVVQFNGVPGHAAAGNSSSYEIKGDAKLTVGASATLTIANGTTLCVIGELVNNGTIDGTGKVVSGTRTYTTGTYGGKISGKALGGTVQTATLVYNDAAAEADKWVAPEAQIGNVSYLTLADAITAAKTGETVKMLKDVKITETVQIDRSLTLDLNGQTITADIPNAQHKWNDARAFTMGTYGESAIDAASFVVSCIDSAGGGKIDTNTGAFCVNSGTLNIGKPDGTCGVAMTNNGKSSAAICNYGEPGVVNVYAATITSTTGACFNIQGNASAVANIYGGTFQQIGHDNYYSTCVGVGCTSAVNIFGGDFTSTDGYAVLGGWNSGSVVRVKGGSFTAAGTCDSAIQLDATVKQSDNIQCAPDWNISDGTFTGKLTIATGEAYPTNFSITGGTFNNMDWLPYAADNASVKLGANVELTETVKIDSGKALTIDLNGKQLTTSNTLATAFKITNGTLTMDDTAGTKGLFRAHGEAFNVLGADSGTTVTAKVIIAAGAHVESDTDCCIYIRKVAGADIYGSLISKGDYATIQGQGIANNAGTVINIYPGAYIEQTKDAAMYIPQNGTLNITGGTIKAATTALEVKAGTVNVSISGNPTFIAGGEAKHVPSSNGNSTAGYALALAENKDYTGDATVTIAGGTFTGPVAKVVDSESSTYTHTLTITGGTFNSDPSDYVDGAYKATESGGTWTVAQKMT